jgi:hypothetical protein
MFPDVILYGKKNSLIYFREGNENARCPFTDEIFVHDAQRKEEH